MRAHVALGLGARLALPGAYLSPSLGFRPSFAWGGWELGLAAAWDPVTTYLPGGLSVPFDLWTLSVGAQVGRRTEVGALELGYGVGLAVSAVRETTTSKVADYAQPRAAAYGRLVGPRTWRARPLLELGADAVLGSLKRKATADAGLPELPRFGGVLSAGAEVVFR